MRSGDRDGEIGLRLWDEREMRCGGQEDGEEAGSGDDVMDHGRAVNPFSAAFFSLPLFRRGRGEGEG